MSLPRISAVHYVCARRADGEAGLLGYVSFIVAGGLRVNGVTLRRTRQGILYFGFPAKGRLEALGVEEAAR